MTWNKGIDVLLRAFARVRRNNPNARLLLKDSRQLFGVGAQEVVDRLLHEEPSVITEEIRASIILVTGTLPLAQMNLLYCAADAYVSPYRAEGFNLPVIEAIASGTLVIVTAGGPTDDFCNASVALKVTSDYVENQLLNIRDSGFHLEPQLDSLVDHMETALQGHGIPREVFSEGRKRLVEDYSWTACTEKLVKLF